MKPVTGSNTSQARGLHAGVTCKLQSRNPQNQYLKAKKNAKLVLKSGT